MNTELIAKALAVLLRQWEADEARTPTTPEGDDDGCLTSAELDRLDTMDLIAKGILAHPTGEAPRMAITQLGHELWKSTGGDLDLMREIAERAAEIADDGRGWQAPCCFGSRVDSLWNGIGGWWS